MAVSECTEALSCQHSHIACCRSLSAPGFRREGASGGEEKPDAVEEAEHRWQGEGSQRGGKRREREKDPSSPRRDDFPCS